MKTALILLLSLFAPSLALATPDCSLHSSVGYWYIGEHDANYPVGRFFHTMNALGSANVLRTGDTVCIDSLDNAFYTNPSNQINMRLQWGNKSGAQPYDNITVMGFRSDTGVPSRFRLSGENTQALNGIGIWDIYIHHFEIDYGEFSWCCNGGGSSLDGLRFEWTMTSATLRHDYFHDNIMGIQMSGASGIGGSLLIEYCEFGKNGGGPGDPTTLATGQTHNLYIDAIDTFTFRYNYTHDSEVGHLFKTRAQHNFIYGNVFLDSQNNRSYDQVNYPDTTSVELNLPVAGTSFIYENIIWQSAFPPSRATLFAQGGNPRIIQYDPECNFGERHYVTTTQLLAPITTTPAPGTVETITVDPSYNSFFGTPPFTVELASQTQVVGQVNLGATTEPVVSTANFPPPPFYINYYDNQVDQVTGIVGNTFNPLVRAISGGSTQHTIIDSSMVYLWHPEQFCVTSVSGGSWTGTRGCNGTVVTTHTFLGPRGVQKIAQMPPAFGDAPIPTNTDSALFVFGNTTGSSVLGFEGAPQAVPNSNNAGVITSGIQNTLSTAQATIQSNTCLMNPKAPLVQNNIFAAQYALTNANSSQATTPSSQPVSVISAFPTFWGAAQEPPCSGSAAPCDSNNANTYASNYWNQAILAPLSIFYSPLMDIKPTWNVIDNGVGFTKQSGTAWTSSYCGGSCLATQFNPGDVITFTTDGTHWTSYICVIANVGQRP